MTNFTSYHPAPHDPVRTAADLLEVVAVNNVEAAIAEMEHLVAKWKQNAQDAAAAKQALRNTSASVLRDAMLFRAARTTRPQAQA